MTTESPGQPRPTAQLPLLGPASSPVDTLSEPHHLLQTPQEAPFQHNAGSLWGVHRTQGPGPAAKPLCAHGCEQFRDPLAPASSSYSVGEGHDLKRRL